MILILTSLWLLFTTGNAFAAQVTKEIDIPRRAIAAVASFPVNGERAPADAFRSNSFIVPPDARAIIIKIDVAEADYLDPTKEFFVAVETFQGGQWTHKISFRYIGGKHVNGATGFPPWTLNIGGGSNSLKLIGKEISVVVSSRTPISYGVTLEVIK